MNNSRKPARGRRRRVNGRFYVFLAILLLSVAFIVGAVVWAMRGRTQPTVDPVVNNPSNVVNVTPASDVEIGTNPSENVSSPDDTTTVSIGSSLADLLAADGSVLAALPEEARVKVDDLSINPNLPGEWKNVLLLGSDERTLTENARTDAIMICSINSQTGQVKLTSILRDLAVDFPDMGELSGTYRINAANYFGGPELAMKKINECFGMNIQSYVTVNFFGFQEIAYRLGGIEVDITEAEMNMINELVIEQWKFAKKSEVDDSDMPMEELVNFGENTHLDGRQALAYARIRKLDSDISRAERQRIVLEALAGKLKGKDAMELSGIALALQPYIKTNMSIDEILSVAVTVLSKDLTMDKMYLPLTGTCKQERRNGQDMLYDCDWGTNTAQLHAFIYE